MSSCEVCHGCFVCCRPSGRRDNTERVIAQWRHLVASGVAMDILHWATPHVSLQRLRMAIKMACDGGAFFRRCRHFSLA